MQMNELAQKLELVCLTPELDLSDSGEIVKGYVSDYFSDVLAYAPAGGVLITIQAQMNALTVALHAQLAAVIFASGRQPDQAVIRRAVEERMPLYSSPASAFDIVGRLFALGLRGDRA